MDETETSDLTRRVALLVAAISACIIGGSALLILWLHPAAPHDRQITFAPPPAPALQTDPRAEMEKFRAEQNRLLPPARIEAAMARLAHDGIPGWPR